GCEQLISGRLLIVSIFFFFQAEDGIRDRNVTGVQTCALPISSGAVSVYMSLSNGSMYARPSISWGPVARDRPGRGCPKAVVSGLSESLSVIVSGDAYGSVDFTVDRKSVV